MALVSMRFPVEFPHHRNWRRDVTHRLFWDLSTSLDHVHAVSAGGAWDVPGNLATVCARCQYQKGNQTLEALGWRRREASQSWDGAVTYYRALWERCGKPSGRAQWIAAYEAAG